MSSQVIKDTFMLTLS